MCHAGNWLNNRTDSFHSMTISSSWFDPQRGHFFSGVFLFISFCLAMCG